MKFVRLEVAGFGPFRKAQLIDFARCNSERLFMVAGQTGSGKTTLLDAISFALYGETTGSGQGSGEVDGRQPSDVRCAACTPKEETYVTLEFEVVRGRFRIRRNPEYPRAAKSGVGITKETAKFTLEQMTEGSWRLVPNLRKVSDFTQFVETLVGLTAEQFRQVIVVPQGRFREVLLSTPAERKELLTHIFGTHLYERFTERVKVQARERKAKLDQLRGNLDVLVRDFAWAWLANVPAHAGAAARPSLRPLAEILDEAKRRLNEARAAEATARQTAADAQSRLARVSEELEVAAMGNRLLDNLAAAIKARAEAAAAVAKLKPTEEELSAANRCARAAHAIKEAETAELKLASVQKGLEALKAEETSLHKSWSEAVKALEAAEEAYAHPSTGHGALSETVRTDQQRLPVLKLAAKERVTKSASLTARRNETLALEEACQATERTLSAAAEAVQIASRALSDARDAQRMARAALLAADLRPGCECPVCGSAQHPKRASLDQPLVTDEMVETLERAEERARNLAATAQGEKLAADARRNASAKAIRQLEDELEASLTDPAFLPDSEIASIEQRVGTMEKSIWELRDTRDRAMRNERKAHEGLEAFKQRWAREAGSADAARADLESKQRLRDAEMGTIGERDAERVKSACRPPEWIASALDQVTRAANDLANADGQIRAATDAAAGAVRRDLRELGQKRDALGAESGVAQTKMTAAAVVSDRLSTLLSALEAHAADMSAAEQDLAPAEELASVIVGATGEQRTSLHAWVLGAYLDEVLSVASLRMRDMTRGRYELHRLQDQQDKRTEAGLSIAVHDSHTGTSRAARTLSGGETFLASLSMALALAEVAGARGGHALDTIFIDEGFGSLDLETLDVAMEVLNQLKAAGRIVGLISHVEDMKRCVHASIHVVKDPVTGTSTVSQS